MDNCDKSFGNIMGKFGKTYLICNTYLNWKLYLRGHDFPDAYFIKKYPEPEDWQSILLGAILHYLKGLTMYLPSQIETFWISHVFFG